MFQTQYKIRLHFYRMSESGYHDFGVARLSCGTTNATIPLIQVGIQWAAVKMARVGLIESEVTISDES